MTWPPGARARAATGDDIEAATDLIAQSERVDIGEVLIDREDVAADWGRPGFDLEGDTRLIHSGDELVAYASVFGGRAFARVAPLARRRGLGRALLDWSERRALEQAGGAGGARLGQTVCDRATDAVELLRANGYTPAYASWVLRLPPAVRLEATVPRGYRIRAMRAGEEPLVFELVEAAFNEWPGRTPSSLQAWLALWIDRESFDPSLLLVAERQGPGGLVGAVLAYAFPDEGWAQQLAVDRHHRGKGLGRALLASVFAELRRRGRQRLGLNTDSRTGALGLYTGLGMQVELSFTHHSRLLGTTP